MVIKSLKLKNYRNYDLLDLKFDPKTNILYGDNAQGKTNILEALYLSGTTKSHRGTKDRDVIQFGYDESHIETIIEKRNIDFQIDMHLKKNSPKGIAIDKVPIRRAGELFGLIPAAMMIISHGRFPADVLIPATRPCVPLSYICSAFVPVSTRIPCRIRYFSIPSASEQGSLLPFPPDTIHLVCGFSFKYSTALSSRNLKTALGPRA